MGDLSTAIRNYIDNEIRLSAKDIQQCAKSRDWFLKRIESTVNARINEPVLYTAEPFIRFGSYFKGTKVADVDEYDILVAIDSCSGQYTSNSQIFGQGQGSASPNHKYDHRFYNADDSVSSQKMVWWLQGVVQEVVDAFGGGPVVGDGIAVTAEIKSREIKIDLVPCGVFKTLHNQRIFYNIGDGKNSWTLTAPREDIDRINSIANSKEDFKNIIRLCKRIKDKYGLSIISFAIETAIADFAEPISDLSWENADLALRTIACIDALVTAIRSCKIMDNWNKNLLDSSIDYELDSRTYNSISSVLNSQANPIQYTSQNTLNRFISSLFENKI